MADIIENPSPQDIEYAKATFFNPRINNPQVTELLTSIDIERSIIEKILNESTQEEIRKLLVALKSNLQFIAKKHTKTVRDLITNTVNRTEESSDKITKIEKTLTNFSHGFANEH